MSWKGKYSGMDTETIGGYAVVLSTEYRSWNAASFEMCVDPMFSDVSSGKIAQRFLTFNLKYDANAILKYLPTEVLKEFKTNVDSTGKPSNTIFYDKYRIMYIPSKLLRISNGNKTISFFDIAQFYLSSLEDASQKYLGEGKVHDKITEEITIRSDRYTDDQLHWYFGEHVNHIKEYCMQDATLTMRLGEYLVNKITSIFGFAPNSLVSKTGIGKQFIRRTVGVVKTDKKYRQTIPAYPKFFGESVSGKFAQAAYHGGIFDCKKRGYFPKVTNIDISSAYPYAMVNMPNWSNGNFFEVPTEDDIQLDDKYGWVMVEFDYPLIPYSSNLVNEWKELSNGEEIDVKSLNTRIFYPTGKRIQVVTLIEYQFLKEFGYLLDYGGGFVWRHNPDKHQYPAPFSWIQEVYDQKLQIKKEGGSGSYEYSLTKIAMNSAYGLTAQSRGMPAFANYFYASTITATTRIQIARMLEEIGYDKYISIATDGILLEGHIDLPNQYIKGGLGSWDVDKGYDAIILSNGIYQYKIEGKDKPKRGTRGLLSYKGDLLQDLKDHRNMSEFVPDMKRRPVTFFQSLYWKKFTKDDMNRFVMSGRKMGCNSDTSKKWKQVKSFGELLNHQYIGKRFTMKEMKKIEQGDQTQLGDF